MRKVSKEKKKSSTKKKPEKNYSMIIEQIDQNYESRKKGSHTEYYQDQPKYRPTQIKEKILPPTIGRRHTDLASYREARKQQKMRQKYSKEMTPATHYSMLEPETGGTRHVKDLINMSYHIPGKILEEEDDMSGRVNNIKPQENYMDLIEREVQKEQKEKAKIYKSGKKKKKTYKGTNKSGTKKSYTSFMKSGNFEKEFMEELNEYPGRKSKKSINRVSIDQNKIKDDYKSKKSEVSNLDYDSQIPTNFISNKRTDYDSFPIKNKINPEHNTLDESKKEVVNIYDNTPKHPVYDIKNKNSDPKIESNSDIQRVSMMEKDSMFYEYSELGSHAVDLSKKSI